jgi:hypothetical protein
MITFPLDFKFRNQNVKANVWKIPAYQHMDAQFHIYNLNPAFDNFPETFIVTAIRKLDEWHYPIFLDHVLFINDLTIALSNTCIEREIDMMK